MCTALKKKTLSMQFLESKLNLKLISLRISPGTKAGDNYMSTIYSVEVKDHEGQIHYWVVKCYPSHPIRQQFANKTNMFFKELFIYQDWIPELRRFQTKVLKLKQPFELAFATFVGGEAIDFSKEQIHNSSEGPDKVYDPLDHFLVLVNLRKNGFQMCDRQIGLDFPHCKLVVEELAKYHALTWSYKQFYHFSSLISKFPLLDYTMDAEDLEITMEILKGSLSLASTALDNHFRTKDCDLSLRLRKFEPCFQEILKVFYECKDERSLDFLCRQPYSGSGSKDGDDELWRVVCHGDCWVNNFLFSYNFDNTNTNHSSWSILRPQPDTVVLVDHAVAREMCPTVELAYMIYTSTTFTLRKNYLDQLLQLYHAKFLESCHHLRTNPMPTFTVDMIRKKFHRAKLYGFTIALLALPMFLKNSCDIVEIDDMMTPSDGSKDYAELKNDSLYMTREINPIFQKRIVELVQEVWQDGIL